MNVDTDTLPWKELPDFLEQTGELAAMLQQMSAEQLQKLWKCNDRIAELNVERLQKMDLTRSLTPALLAYEGIQYQYMAPKVFTDRQLAYVQEHLRILSGFYGMLRPLDGVVPYRLEMQAKLAAGGAKDLYGYWGDRMAAQLAKETDWILNLASKEYSQSVSRHLPASVRLITCVFGSVTNGKIVEKGTMCKMARGEMVRFLAEELITDPEGVKRFDRQYYRYAPEYSDDNTFVFLAGQQE